MWPPRQLVFPPPRALPAEARVAPLPAPLGTCYSWQRQLENGRQQKNFVCSGLGSGQTSGLQLSGARDRPPYPPYGPGIPQHGPHTRAGECLSRGGGCPATTGVLSVASSALPRGQRVSSWVSP